MASEEHQADTLNLQVRDAHGRLAFDRTVTVAPSYTSTNLCRVRSCIGAPSPDASS